MVQSQIKGLHLSTFSFAGDIQGRFFRVHNQESAGEQTYVSYSFALPLVKEVATGKGFWIFTI
ncbi:hypothetical protein SCA6_016162 [Theobroma cacao]